MSFARLLRPYARRAIDVAVKLRYPGPAVPACLPHPQLIFSKSDSVLSPYTGMNRAAWENIAKNLLENALAYTDGLRHPIGFPWPTHQVRPDRDSIGPPTGFLEAYSRTLLLAAPLLRREPDLRFGGKLIADYYRDSLLKGVEPSGRKGFGRPRGNRPNQHTVEAAGIVIALLEAPEVLWAPLSAAEQGQVLDWLEYCLRAPVPPTNWRWFAIIVDMFLRRMGRGNGVGLRDAHLEAIRALYVDAGWYLDHTHFDFYSAWAMQFYPMLWSEWDPEAPTGLVEEFADRHDAFLLTYPHVFSRQGHMPMWGRSLCYRYTASAVFPLAFRRSSTPAIDPGFARRLCSGNILQFVEHPHYLKDGLPSLGFYGADPSQVDPYSTRASPFWCAKLFMALSLPDDSPFWTATENEGFWTDPPDELHFGKTGLRVVHDRTSGHSRLYTPAEAGSQDPRYKVPWVDTRGV